MTRREAFLKAMRRESEGYVPRRLSLCPPQLDRFEREFGHRDVATEWDFAERSVSLPFHPTCDDFLPWLGEIGPRTRVDEWGIGHEAAADGSHFTRLIHPLAGASSAGEIRDFPLPESADADDVARAAVRAESLCAADLIVQAAVCPVGGTVFWPAYKMRGMENLLCDFLVNPSLAEALLDRVTDLCAAQARMAARSGADVIHMADDLGTQRSTYISPGLFRDWIKPRLAAVIGAAKAENADVLIHFHSDGAVTPFIPDLVEIGVDILNPIQPECMDAGAIKREFGDVLSLSGGVGTQTTMPFGTPEEVRERVRWCCDNLGRGGGLWLAPTHVVEPEVPWQNILAFIEASGPWARVP